MFTYRIGSDQLGFVVDLVPPLLTNERCVIFSRTKRINRHRLGSTSNCVTRKTTRSPEQSPPHQPRQNSVPNSAKPRP